MPLRGGQRVVLPGDQRHQLRPGDGLGQVVVDLLQRHRVQRPAGSTGIAIGAARTAPATRPGGRRAAGPPGGPRAGRRARAATALERNAGREQERERGTRVVRLAAQDELQRDHGAQAIATGRKRRAAALRSDQTSPATQTGVSARPV